jgi:hypothetical protein
MHDCRANMRPCCATANFKPRSVSILSLPIQVDWMHLSQRLISSCLYSLSKRPPELSRLGNGTDKETKHSRSGVLLLKASAIGLLQKPALDDIMLGPGYVNMNGISGDRLQVGHIRPHASQA